VTGTSGQSGLAAAPGDTAVLDLDGLGRVFRALAERGYETIGPTVRDGAIVYSRVSGPEDLPRGWHDEQEPGKYRLIEADDGALFGWAVGPTSLKAQVFPPSQQLWKASRDENGQVHFIEESHAAPPMAIVGLRPCELVGLRVLDRVLVGNGTPDPRYEARRDKAFLVVAECGSPASTCFCESMGTGPAAGAGYDLALTEVLDGEGHRFVVRVGSRRGAEVLAAANPRAADVADTEARNRVLALATSAMSRRLDTEDLPELLGRSIDSEHWDDVAKRCLACGNCTLVCPTCFCSDVRDTTDLYGSVSRTRTWASCFDREHSYLHGGAVRSSIASRYRQWLTHKLSTWWDQFGSSGCVGCGRCITWCPVGIDLVAEVGAIRAKEGEPS
jgi:sulfhydrogenase subunit beta (sulfur reductase)